MDLKDIQNLIEFISKTDLAEVNLKIKDFEIKVKTGKGQVAIPPTPLQLPPAASLPQNNKSSKSADVEESKVEDNHKYITIKSPMIGTFYRKPSPDKPYFTNVGEEVSIGQTICVIEAMKLFNEIESEVNGKIVKVLVEDSSPVEFDQPLFLVDPS